MKFFLFLAFAASLFFAEFVLEMTAFAQSGAPTGTLVNPSVPNGVESNPGTFENVQPVLGSTPPPTKAPKIPKHVMKPSTTKMKTSGFASPPDTMQKETGTPEPKVRN